MLQLFETSFTQYGWLVLMPQSTVSDYHSWPLPTPGKSVIHLQCAGTHSVDSVTKNDR
jgi:hypothetical protein